MDQKYIMDKLKEHDEKINKLSENQVESKTILKSIHKTHEELSSTMKDIVKTMTNIDISMNNMQNNLTNNTNEICNLNTKIDNIDKKVNEDIGKYQIDTRDLLKDSLIKILTNTGKYGIIGTAFYGIYELINK